MCLPVLLLFIVFAAEGAFLHPDSPLCWSSDWLLDHCFYPLEVQFLHIGLHKDYKILSGDASCLSKAFESLSFCCFLDALCCSTAPSSTLICHREEALSFSALSAHRPMWSAGFRYSGFMDGWMNVLIGILWIWDNWRMGATPEGGYSYPKANIHLGIAIK